MATNNPLSRPALGQPMVDKNGNATPSWVKWFDNLHQKISPNRTRQVITGACSVNGDCGYASLTTTSAAYAITLPAPTVPNIWLQIEMIARGSSHNVTMALTNCTGGTASTTCTWTGTNQQLILQSSGLKWVIHKQNNVTLS